MSNMTNKNAVREAMLAALAVRSIATAKATAKVAAASKPR